MDKKTIDYYNSNATEFFETTVEADMKAQYEMFEKKLSTGASILDLGCGSGRDTKYFIDKGYKVTAIDGSNELCKKASEYAGIEVKNMLFQEIDYENEFDGIWACASLLHVPFEELSDIMNRLVKALKRQGIIYASFKYGDYSGERKGRFFTDLTDETLEHIVGEIPELVISEKYVSIDVRPGRDEKWLNVILVKIKND